jgi:hypothetical protein
MFTPKMAYNAVKYGPSVYRAAKKVYGMGRAANNRYKRNMAAARRSKAIKSGLVGNSVGVYAGRFRKPTRAKTSKIADYLSSGSVCYEEAHGDVVDPDCVYLGASTHHRDEIPKTIFYSLIKKLYRKAGVNLDSVLEELPNFDYNDATNATLKVVWREPGNSPFTAQYNIPQDATLSSLFTANACNLPLWITQRLHEVTAGSGYNVYPNLERIYLIRTDATTLLPGNVRAELNCLQEVIQFEVIVNMTIQNRTKGAIGGSGDSETDRVDSQPLIGKLYEFSGGVPKERQKGATDLEAIEYGGVIKQAATDFGGEVTLYREPPPAKHFSNVTKCSGVTLQPGTIKRHMTKYYKRCYLNNFFKAYKASYMTGNTGFITSATGKCFLFCFEEVLNSGSSNNITVTFEIDRKTMCKLITAKPSPMKAALSIRNLNV